MAVHLLDDLVFTLELEGKTIIIDYVALSVDIVLLFLFVFDHLQDRIPVRLPLDSKLFRYSHIFVRLYYFAAYLQGNRRVVIDEIFLHDLEDTIFAYIAVVLSQLLLV